MGIDEGDPYAQAGDPPVWLDYKRILREAGAVMELEAIPKWDFYRVVASDDHVLTVQTAEQALWANILLSVGCRQD